jgi:hypothetical protein
MKPAPLSIANGGALASTTCSRLGATARCRPDIHQLCHDTGLVHGVDPLKFVVSPTPKPVAFPTTSPVSLVLKVNELLREHSFIVLFILSGETGESGEATAAQGFLASPIAENTGP